MSATRREDVVPVGIALLDAVEFAAKHLADGWSQGTGQASIKDLELDNRSAVCVEADVQLRRRRGVAGFLLPKRSAGGKAQ